MFSASPRITCSLAVVFAVKFPVFPAISLFINVSVCRIIRINSRFFFVIFILSIEHADIGLNASFSFYFFLKIFQFQVPYALLLAFRIFGIFRQKMRIRGLCAGAVLWIGELL